MQRGQRLQHRRVLVGGNVGIARQRRLGGQHLAVCLRRRAPGLLQLQRALVRGRLRHDAGLQELALPCVLGLRRFQRVVGRRGFGLRLRVGCLQLLDLEARRLELRAVFLDRVAIGGVIDGEELLAGTHRLVLVHVHRGDLSAHLRHDRDPVLLDVGVLGRDVAPARHPDISAAQREREREGRDQQAPLATPRSGRRLGFLRLGFRRCLDFLRFGFRRRFTHRRNFLELSCGLCGHASSFSDLLRPATVTGQSSPDRLSIMIRRLAWRAARSCSESPAWACW